MVIVREMDSGKRLTDAPVRGDDEAFGAAAGVKLPQVAPRLQEIAWSRETTAAADGLRAHLYVSAGRRC